MLYRHTDRSTVEVGRARRPETRLRVVGAALPAAFLTTVILADLLTPAWYFPFSPPLIVVVPALAAATSGIAASAVYTVLSILASFLLMAWENWQQEHIFYAQLAGLIAIFVVSLIPGRIRAHRERTVRRLRSVVEVVQRAVLPPLPERTQCLRAAADYLPADEEARIGGDLYDIVETPFGVRMIVGDARGKGLAAVAAATNLLGAFREAATHAPTLPELADWLECSVRRYGDRTGGDTEDFITATLVSVQPQRQTQMLCCGHPGPLILRSGQVSQVTATRPAPPLGVGDLAPSDRRVDTFAFDADDLLLLYTDGVIEARDAGGDFYPLAERVMAWADADPGQLVKHLVHDLRDYTQDRLNDDVALLAVQRLPQTE